MKYYTVKEISERLKISQSLVYQEIRSGRLPCHRFGKRTYRVSEDDLSEYERGRKTNPDTGAVPRPVARRGERLSRFQHIDVSRLPSRRK